MPNIAAAFESTNPSAQAVGCGIPAPAIVFQPGGTRAANVYTTEALLAQIVTAAFGMNGPFPVYLDFTANSDAYTASGTLSFGGHATVIGVVNPSNGALPALTTAHTIAPPSEIRDVALACTLAGTVFTSAPKALRLSGQTTLTCASGTTLYAAAAAGYKLFVADTATLGDGTHAVVSLGASGAVALYVGPAATLNAAAFAITAGGALTIYAAPGASIDASYIGMSGVTIVGGGGGGGGVTGPALDVYAATLTALETGLATASAESFAVSRFYCNFGAITLPSGSYNPGLMSDWIADPTAATVPAVTLAAGVTLTHFPYRLRGVALKSSASPTGAVFSGATVYCELVNGSITSAASLSHPILDVSSETATIDLRGASQIAGTSGVHTSGIIDMVTPASGFTVVVNLYDAASVGVASFGSALLTYAGAHSGSLRIVRYSSASQVLDPLLLPFVVEAGVGMPAPSVVFQPGGTANGNNLVTNEASLNHVAATADGPVTVFVDLSQSSDVYSTAAAITLGSSYTLCGVLDQSDGQVPNLTLAFQIGPPTEIRDVVLDSSVSGSAFTSSPTFLRISGQSQVAGSTLFHVTTGNQCLLLLEDLALLNSGAITVDSGATMTVYVAAMATLAAGAITVTSGGSLVIYTWGTGVGGVGVDRSYFGATGVSVVDLTTAAPLSATNTGATVTHLNPPAKTLVAVTNSAGVIAKLPAVASIPDGWDVVTVLETGGNALTVEVDGASSEQLRDPVTGALGTSWSTAASGNLANTVVVWRWRATHKIWSSSAGVAMQGLGTAGQVLLTNSGATGTAWASLSQDATMTAAGAVTVAGLRTVAVPTLAPGFLAYTGSAFTWTVPGGAQVVTYQPGGVASGTTFTSFSALITYLGTLTAYYVEVLFDNAYLGFGENIVLPAVAFPGAFIQWTAVSPDGIRIPITVPAGFTMPGLDNPDADAFFGLKNLNIESHVTSPLATFTQADLTLFMDGAIITPITTSVLFEMTGGTELVGTLTNGSILNATSGFSHFPLSLDSGNGSAIELDLFARSSIASNAFIAPTGSVVLVNAYEGSSVGAQSTYGAQWTVTATSDSTVGAITGGSLTYLNDASRTAYVATSSSNWTSSPISLSSAPTLASTALDALAAFLHAGGGGGGGISALTGDVTASGSGSVAATVARIQNIAVTSGAPTKGQFFTATSTSSWGATSLSGDVTASASTAGLLTVTAIQGNTVPSGALTKGQFLIAGSTSSWGATSLSGDVATDATTPGLTYVVSIAGPSGAGGTVPLGDGTHNTFLTMRTSLQTTPPILVLFGAPGFVSSGANGGAGGNAEIVAGAGAVGTGTNKVGGTGGAFQGQGGNAGASTGTAANADGGPCNLYTGQAGSGGSGAAGKPGQFTLSIGLGTSAIQLQNDPANDYIALGGPAGSGTGHTAQSGFFRVPANAGTVLAARNKGDTGDDVLVQSSVAGGTSTAFFGGSSDRTLLRAGTLVQTLCNVEQQQGTSGSALFTWTRNAGQGTASSQNTNHLDDIGVVTVSASSTATAYTFNCPVGVSATVKITVCCRATGAPSGGAIGDTYSAEVLATFKNTVAGGVLAVGSATALAVTDASLSAHVALSSAVFSTGEVDLKIGNTSSASLDCTMKVAIVFN